VLNYGELIFACADAADSGVAAEDRDKALFFIGGFDKVSAFDSASN